MTPKFELFSDNKINSLYLTEIMLIYGKHTFDEYCEERDTPYSDDFGLWHEWLFTYFNEMLLGEAIEIAYLMWKSEQHRLTLKYYILRSLVPLIK